MADVFYHLQNKVRRKGNLSACIRTDTEYEKIETERETKTKEANAKRERNRRRTLERAREREREMGRWGERAKGKECQICLPFDVKYMDMISVSHVFR